MKKKKGLKINKQSLKKILAIVVVFLLVFGIGYLLGVCSMNMVPKVDIQEYERIVKTDDKRVTNLLNNLTAGADCWNVEDYANDHKVNVKNVSNDRIYQVVQWGSLYGKEGNVSLEEFRDEIKKYFSIGFDFDPEKIDQENGCNPYRYNKEKQEFEALNLACQSSEGLCGPNRTLYKIMSVEDNGFDLKVTVNVLFGSQAESTSYYADYERTVYVTDDYNNIDQFFEDGNAYLFTFLRVDDRYLFVSSEKV